MNRSNPRLRRLGRLYRKTAILFFNTVLLFGLVEFGIRLFEKAGEAFLPPDRSEEADPRAFLSYYAGQDWGAAYWEEFEAAGAGPKKSQYRPFIVWDRYPIAGDLINIDADGLRRTPGAVCEEGSFTVFAFGGSTMWGTGAPDWGTIPAYLQQRLDKSVVGPVCVVNYGETAYVATQSFVALSLALQSGARPDLVIFYDGWNEVVAAYQSGAAGDHHNLSQIAARFEARRPSYFSGWLNELAVVRRAAGLAERLPGAGAQRSAPTTYQTLGVAPEGLARSIADEYFGVYDLVRAQAAAYGFDMLFFWQPMLATGQKPLTAEETVMRESIDPALVVLLEAADQQIRLRSNQYETLYYLGELFDTQEGLIYIDDVHVSPDGNRLVADAINEKVRFNE